MLTGLHILLIFFFEPPTKCFVFLRNLRNKTEINKFDARFQIHLIRGKLNPKSVIIPNTIAKQLFEIQMVYWIFQLVALNMLVNQTHFTVL